MRGELDTGALSRHIGRLFCRAAALTRRGGASQKESLGPRTEFRRLSMPTIAGANFRVGRQPTGAATSVNTRRLHVAYSRAGSQCGQFQAVDAPSMGA